MTETAISKGTLILVLRSLDDPFPAMYPSAKWPIAYMKRHALIIPPKCKRIIKFNPMFFDYRKHFRNKSEKNDYCLWVENFNKV